MSKSDETSAEKGPQIPLTATPANLVDQVERYRGMLDPTMRVQEPAAAVISALAVRQVIEAAQKNHLGTHRPSEYMIGTDATNTYMYIVPVAPKTPGATPVKYQNGRAQFNLYPLFAKLDRLVPEGRREYYDVLPTPGEVTIGNVVKGWGVYVNLNRPTTEPITPLSEEEKARRAAKRRQTMDAKKAKGTEKDQAS